MSMIIRARTSQPQQSFHVYSLFNPAKNTHLYVFVSLAASKYIEITSFRLLTVRMAVTRHLQRLNSLPPPLLQQKHFV